MKKRFLCILMITLFIFANLSVLAESSSSLSDAIDGIWMKHYIEICNKVNEHAEQSVEQYQNQVLNDVGLKHKYGTSFEERVYDEVEHYKTVNTPDTENAYRFYHLDTPKYAVQYAEIGVIDYLLCEYWLVPKKPYRNNQEVRWDFYSSNVEKCENTHLSNLKNSTKPVITTETKALLSNYDGLEAILKNAGAQGFLDFKVIDVDSVHTILYFKYSNGEYGILTREEDNNRNKPDLEQFKVYDFKYMLQKIGETQVMGIGGTDISTKELLDKKNVFEEEAKILQQGGLLLGNEKGLDLLKPLTRAEAVTLLVRALGLDSEVSQYTISSFSDISSSNWASPYASLARAKGIAYGVSDTEFAPNAGVTADQFASFTLRASGESDFDYTQGLEILIDKGIITEEESETMDLFTRGDMAKIIYEAREKGLL